MSGFITKLQVQKRDIHSDSNEWILLSDFEYQSDVLGHVVVVPQGFITDFASVPRLPFTYLFFGNSAQEAAVIHDYLYRHRSVSRAKADAVFREASEVAGVPAWRRWGMWLGVRIGGWTVY